MSAVNALWNNPLATRYVRPGALEFELGSGRTLDELAAQLAEQGWWGEITGPHGVGKSTLLASLTPVLERAGRRVVRIALRNGQRRSPSDVWQRLVDPSSADVLLVVDGYEQLGRFARGSLKRRCRRRSWGLLVTAHRAMGLPPLARPEADLATVQRLVDRLLSDAPGALTPDDVAAAHFRHGQNVRETLFELYKLYELRNRRDRRHA